MQSVPRIFAVFLIWTSFLTAQDIALEKTETGYDIRLDGKPFAGYVEDFQSTPIVWPIHGPSGERMTREFPMARRQDDLEMDDHPHHRSLWFSHGEVNGADFWTTGNGKGKIVHRAYKTAECKDGKAVLVTDNDWLDKGGKVICRDERTLRFGNTGAMRFIDFDVTVTAIQDTVVFGETKEGTFGLRVPGTLDLTAGKRNPAWGGRILNAEGVKNGATWGKRSAWVDYSGPVEGKTVGIAILNHPSSFRYPTYWHVRDYGLFAANPFGVHDFDKNIPKGTGSLTLKKGESFTLRYRVLLHDGNAEDARIAEAFEQYAGEWPTKAGTERSAVRGVAFPF